MGKITQKWLDQKWVKKEKLTDHTGGEVLLSYWFVRW